MAAAVTVSPKPPEYMITYGLKGLVDELKVIVAPDADVGALERVAAFLEGAVVSIQPEYAGGPGDPVAAAAMEKAVALVMQHPNWRLSLQIHKYLAIR